jgi:hypothetical protein
MSHPLRQIAGVVLGAFASLAICYVILSFVVLAVAGEFGGSFADLSSAFSSRVPNRTTYLSIVATMVLSATASAGYLAALLGGGPGVPLGALSSLVVAGLFVRAAQRVGPALELASITFVVAIVASAALGGYLRHRQVERRIGRLPLW